MGYVCVYYVELWWKSSGLNSHSIREETEAEGREGSRACNMMMVLGS